MGRWKRFGIIVVEYRYDHPPRHVHLFEDGKRVLRFDVDHWEVMEGRLTPAGRRALEQLRAEGAFNEKSKI